MSGVDDHWEYNAPCGKEDPDLFVPLSVGQYRAGTRAADDPRIRKALTVCDGCPVWKRCVATRAAYVDVPMTGVYGRQYVDIAEGRRRVARAQARHGRLVRKRVGVFPRPNRRKAA